MATQLSWYRNAYRAARQRIRELGKNASEGGMPLQFTEGSKVWTFGFWIIDKDPLSEHRREANKAGFLTKKAAGAIYLRKKEKR